MYKSGFGSGGEAGRQVTSVLTSGVNIIALIMAIGLLVGGLYVGFQKTMENQNVKSDLELSSVSGLKSEIVEHRKGVVNAPSNYKEFKQKMGQYSSLIVEYRNVANKNMSKFKTVGTKITSINEKISDLKNNPLAKDRYMRSIKNKIKNLEVKKVNLVKKFNETKQLLTKLP